MDYQTAKRIAIENPGYVIRRSESGDGFVVVDNKGFPIGESAAQAKRWHEREVQEQEAEKKRRAQQEEQDRAAKKNEHEELEKRRKEREQLTNERLGIRHPPRDWPVNPQPVTVNCQCGGTNENCNFCGGKGWYERAGP